MSDDDESDPLAGMIRAFETRVGREGPEAGLEMLRGVEARQTTLIGALYTLCLQWSLRAEAMGSPEVRSRPLPEEVLDQCAVELGAVLDRYKPKEPTTARCAEPDCGRVMDVQAGQTEPYYCPRCWQARGSKESER